MATFDAAGVVRVQGPAGARPAVGVAVTFTAARAIAAPTRSPIGPRRVLTDKAGRWAQDGFDTRLTYNVHLSGQGLVFPPAQPTVDAAHRVIDVTATVATYTTSGVVRSAPPLVTVPGASSGKPPGLAGVTVRFLRGSGRSDVPVPGPVVTDQGGGWQQSGFQVGSTYLAMPDKPGLAFSPASVTVSGGSTPAIIGDPDGFSVEGRVVTAGGAVEPGVRVEVTDLSGATGTPPATRTGADGRFSLALSRSRSYRLTPTKSGLRFAPASADVAFRGGALPRTFIEFRRVTNLVVVGQVLSTGGAALLSAVVSFRRLAGSGAIPLPVTTTSNGEFRAQGADAGTTYEVQVRREGFGFAPVQLLATQAGTTTLNVTGSPAFDVAGVVRQGPDAAGLGALLGGAGVDLDEIAPPVPNAVVFFAAPAGALAPEPVVTGPDGTFRQSGFEVGRTYTAEARASGFVSATGVTLSGAPGADLSRQSVTRSAPGLLEGVSLLLAPAS